MKYIILILLVALVGCMPTPYYFKNFQVGAEMNATAGSPMITVLKGYNSGGATHTFSGIKLELYYEGIDHNVLQVGYREFNAVDDDYLARPAFYQSLKYDISKSDTIAFRELKIKVKDANSVRITYTVIDAPGTGK